ncbi:MAG: pilus assembly protein PilM [Candidatus Delongbacteria bacterium]|nr:pilus assembly protein PilM [Candidatus Delongbacteria bacterium]
MTEDSKKESKSIGRNIFAESKSGGLFKDSDKNVPASPKSDEPKPKSIGRNIFSEVPQSPSPKISAKDDDLKIIEKSTSDFRDTKVTKSPGSVQGKINAIHISNEVVCFAQTVYDGMKYKLTNLQVAPIELPPITEENVLKDKEDKNALINKLKLEAIEKVFSRAGVSKNDPHIVCSLNGPKIILKQIYVKDTPVENIEAELPTLVKSPFNQIMSRYEYEIINSDGMNHNILVCIADSTVFFETQGIMANAGIECKIMDIDKMALVNLYNESVRPPDGTVSCIIDIGYDYSHIIIVPNGKEELYIRNIDFTYNAFRRTLQKNRDITLAETEEMIRTRNFYDYITSAFEAETTENLNQHFSVKQYIRMQFIRELTKTFQYYSQQNMNKIPSRIYITGKALEMNKFAQFVNKNTDIPCEKLDVTGFFSGDVSVTEQAKEKESDAYIAIGLALRYE